MARLPHDWEKRLQESPFADRHFTEELQRNVNGRLNNPPQRKLRRWTYAAAMLPLVALMLVIGYSSGGFSSLTDRPDHGVVSNGENSPDPGEAGTQTSALSFPSPDISGGEVQLPLVTVLAVPSVDDGYPAVKNPVPSLPDMTYPLSAEMADQLQATLVYGADGKNSYLLLSPAGWEASAVIGANGSYGLTFTDPADPAQTLAYTDTNWSCQGCAIGDIGLYFPEKAGWAEDQGFPVYVPLDFKSREMLGTGGDDGRTVRYTLQPDKDGLLADGAAYYEEGNWGYLIRRIELRHASGIPENAALESILGFFAASNGALILPEAGLQSEEADPDPYSTSDLLSVLEQQGLRLTSVGPGDEHMFNKELAGVWPDEELIDYEGPLSIPDRLSIYTYDSVEACAEGLEALKLEINRTTYDGGARIYPHAFRGGNFLVVYWMGPGGEGGFKYDKAIKTALAGFNSRE
ncbi:DUF4850 domain-containing protein [Paenibacillus sp. DMB5]|uniref:DUF4850 domain-containing protein n=1 Tax=Paenibacillus sp. DMB5 TaxID=1780103 RepID=UPI00076DE3D2|nr:DUF4850 domain-containing protein [Paenibacillus sp. DMB5]KUP24548.1 hypothetical protein AWJ19_19605 [Paenibacillus sp. DMB5]